MRAMRHLTPGQTIVAGSDGHLSFPGFMGCFIAEEDVPTTALHGRAPAVICSKRSWSESVRIDADQDSTVESRSNQRTTRSGSARRTGDTPDS